MMYKEFFNLNFNEACIRINGYDLIEVQGVDAKQFLNGQLTSNIIDILPNTFERFCRLNQRGNISFDGFVFDLDGKIFLIIDSEICEGALKDLDNFIISEDVNFVKSENMDGKIYFSTAPIEGVISIPGIFNLMPGFILIQKSLEIHESNIDQFQRLNLISINEKGGLFNESVLSLASSHGSKGCYVGNEIVSKISNNRGARRFPLILVLSNLPNCLKQLESDSKLKTIDDKEFGELITIDSFNEKFYALVKAKREFHEEINNINLKLHDEIFEADIFVFRDFVENEFPKLSNDFFLEGVDYLNQSQNYFAKKYFSLSLLLNRSNKDSLEALGVLFGRENFYSYAHKLMDELLSLDPNSIMAHTNKSLFFMNEGRIEEAEKEKEIALNKSNRTDLIGETDKNIILEKKQKQLAMYKEVLELDPDDTFAFNKCLEIYYELESFDKVQEMLQLKDVENHPQLFIWKYKCALSTNTLSDNLLNKIPLVLKIALKSGDKTSADYLKKIKK